MKIISWLEKFDADNLFNAFIYAGGLFFIAGAIKELFVRLFPDFSKMTHSLIFIGLYVGLLFFSKDMLIKGKFRTSVRYISLGLLIIFLIKFILIYGFKLEFFISLWT